MFQNSADGSLAVGQVGQDGEDVVFEVGTGEELFGGQGADVHDAALVGPGGGGQAGRHAQGAFSDVDHDLGGEDLVATIDGEGVFRHAEGHAGIVAALELDVDEVTDLGSSEQVNVAGSDFGQFRAEPFSNAEAGEGGEEAALELALEEGLQRDIELVQGATKSISGWWRTFSQGSANESYAGQVQRTVAAA